MLNLRTPIINARLDVMPPISDFNFMVTGIATFATTVGYSYASYKFNPTTWVLFLNQLYPKIDLSPERADQ